MRVSTFRDGHYLLLRFPIALYIVQLRPARIDGSGRAVADAAVEVLPTTKTESATTFMTEGPEGQGEQHRIPYEWVHLNRVAIIGGQIQVFSVECGLPRQRDPREFGYQSHVQPCLEGPLEPLQTPTTYEFGDERNHPFELDSLATLGHRPAYLYLAGDAFVAPSNPHLARIGPEVEGDLAGIQIVNINYHWEEPDMRQILLADASGTEGVCQALLLARSKLHALPEAALASAI